MKNTDAIRQMRKGVEEESEHAHIFDKIKAGKLTKQGMLKQIVKDHLKKNPNYYDQKGV
jgi:hypothetical protein